ncbi:MAG: selenoneine biosynthesis selenosugar synthase SenB [Sciscionella sp.]
MLICLITPAARHTFHGNRVTAQRWAGMLSEMGHRVQVAQEYRDQPADLLLALHARKSAASVRRFRSQHPNAPIVLALTGTDLYPDLVTAGVSLDVLEMADRLVVLQHLATRQVPQRLAGRARVIHQSVAPHVTGSTPPARSGTTFDVALLAHLRPVKDPLLGAAAARLLSPDSRVRIRHAGAVIDPELGRRAEQETRRNPRYDWLGERSRDEALSLLRGSRLLLLTSRHEGGANVISEALAAGVPVVCSAIPGSIGLLGESYPGYFPTGDPAALADLLAAFEADRDDIRTAAEEHCTALRPLVDPATEGAAWARLLAELPGPVSR